MKVFQTDAQDSPNAEQPLGEGEMLQPWWGERLEGFHGLRWWSGL